MNNKANTRIWELDFFRGIALLMMIYFHAIYDMVEFVNGFNIKYDTGINFYIGKISVILFIIISGISSNLSRSNVKRGLKLLGVALLISLFSYIYDKNFVIKFGIIHFFAVCMIIFPLLNKINRWLLPVIGTLIIVLGQFTTHINVSYDYLFPFGVTSPNFISSDYYSLIPWIGLFMYGMFLGKTIYSNKNSLFNFSIPNNPISMIGRHTLIVYIIHQPIILLSLYLLGCTFK